MSSNNKKINFKFKNQLLYRRINVSFSVMAISVTCGGLALALVVIITMILSMNRKTFLNQNALIAETLTANAQSVVSHEGDPIRLEFIENDLLRTILDEHVIDYHKFFMGSVAVSNYHRFDEIAALSQIKVYPFSLDLKPVRIKDKKNYYYFMSYNIILSPTEVLQVSTIDDITENYFYAVIISIVIGSSFLIIIFFLVFLGRFVSRRALAPLSEIAKQVRNISEANLSLTVNPSLHPSEVDVLLIELNNMLIRLETAFEEQKRFVSDVSHELRIPLTIIQGYIDIMQSWGKDDAHMMAESLETMTMEIANMKRLVENLLYLENLGSGNINLNIESVNIPELIDKVVGDAQLLTDHHTVTASVKSPTTSLLTDKNVLEQAIRATVDNAIKYTENGGTITIGCSSERGMVTIFISDTGIGISEEHLSSVAQRFYRVDASRSKKAGGSGLGLSIVDASIRALRGIVAIESVVGFGTTVSFVFKKLLIHNP